MLQHLSSLRASVTGLCPVYHPWVRHMANQDRWIVRVNEDGSPESVVLVPALDAKFLITIAKDNHNSFPAFKSRSLPLRFAKELLDIYTDGPMARLLSSAVKIGDQEPWWAAVDKLIQGAAVEDKYKDIETFSLDVAAGDSAIQQSMRASLSDALFAWEAKSGTEEYEMNIAPRPKLPILGLCYLLSRNVDIPSFTRYGMSGLASYPVHKQTVREMAASLEWITNEKRRGKTWQAVPGKDNDSPDDLLIIHVSGDPDVQIRLAEFFGELQEPDDNREAYYAALAESVTKFFSDEKATHGAKDNFLNLLLLRKVSPGVTRVETCSRPSPK